ncbi:MAG: RNA polymerase sigma factor [Asticcacaulis sp.]
MLTGDMLSNAAALSRLLISERLSLIRRIQRMVGSRSLAEDITQNLWFRIQRIDDHPPIVNKRAYLYRLASNLAIDQTRSARTQAGIFASDAQTDSIAHNLPSAEKQVLDAEALGVAMRALSELSPRCQEVLRLRRLEDMSAADIAARLGISRQMVWRYLTEAMNHLSDRLYGDDA